MIRQVGVFHCSGMWRRPAAGLLLAGAGTWGSLTGSRRHTHRLAVPPYPLRPQCFRRYWRTPPNRLRAFILPQEI